MAGPNLPYLPPLFGRNIDTLSSLFREVEKTFEDFSRRAPWSGFGEGAIAPKVDVAEGSDGIDVIAELPGVDEKILK